jgi:hypothetical protein
VEVVDLRTTATVALRYLKRQSWTSRQALINHPEVAWPEYNERYAHPFAWTWTSQKMRVWFDKHAPNNCDLFSCIIYGQRH